MRNSSVLRICLVFSDDLKGLLSAIVAYDRHQTSELDGVGPCCWVHNIGVGAAGAPIAQLTSSFGQRFSIAVCLGFAILPSRSFQGCLDQFQPPLGDQIGMLGNRSVGKLLDVAIFVNECSAHKTAYGVNAPFFTLPAGSRPALSVPKLTRTANIKLN